MEKGYSIPVLDHGFVRYVDHLGSDTRIAETARVSFGQGSKGPEADKKLVLFLYKNRHTCYDASTEVLTRRGFVKWEALIKEEDELAVFDPATGYFVGFEKPKRYVDQLYDGPMIHFRDGDIDLRVTPNHKVYARYPPKDFGRGSWFMLMDADYAASRYIRMARAGSGNRSTEACAVAMAGLPCYHFGRLVGFFIGDGYGESSKALSFHLRKDRKVTYLREVCEALDLEVICRANDTYAVTRKNLGAWMRHYCYNSKKEKGIPTIFLSACNDCQTGLLEGLRESDGSRKRGTWAYSTSSPTLADQIQALGVLAGLPFSVSYGSGGPTMIKLSACSRRVATHVNDSRGGCRAFTEPYAGRIYCAEVSTGLLAVRRNEKTTLSGNSPFEGCNITFEIQMPIFVMRQFVRHRTFRLNEISARYTELPELFYVPETWRGQDTKNKQGSAGVISFPEEADKAVKDANSFAWAAYQYLLAKGIAKELARIVLPVNIYTRIYVNCDLHNLTHFLRLRTDAHAQWEIQEFARAMQIIASEIFPWTFEAYNRYKVEIKDMEPES